MKTTMTLKAVLLTLVTVCSVNVYAEKLSGLHDTLPQFAFQLMDQAGAIWTDGVQVYDHDTEDVFRVFCSDLFTSTSTAFFGGGQLYHSTALTDSPFHSTTQKAQLQSLFDHVYTKAFNADYSFNDGLYAAIFQLAVWEIANDTADKLSLRNGEGDIYITKAMVIRQNTGGSNYWDNTVLTRALDTLDSWFDAIINDTWENIGYSEDKVDLTVYIADGGQTVSQTFVGVAPRHPEAGASIATPEPATILIIGLGIVGLGLARRRK